MQIYGPSYLHGAQPVNAPHTSRVSQSTAAGAGSPIQDELQISSEGQFVDRVRELPDIRQDRVNQIRAQIAQGTYETDDKLNVAVGRLLDEIG
ncbi:MAG: flagellar biosynthesis anti-sigma factor FlgM [Thermoguttaceae bacterium]|jgi:negative regulator of flagellin synthesis FlgM